MPIFSSSYRLKPGMAYVTFALLATLIVYLHTDHFQGRAYRQDEAWIVHAALEKQTVGEMVRWDAIDIHPPLWVMVAYEWVNTFGQNEIIVRILSSLFTLLTLALVFRLASDLYSYTAGLVAVFILGTLAFFQFYSHEFRPYAALAAATIALQLIFLRWLRHSDFKHALLLVLAGIAAVYTHFYAFYVLAALVIFFLVFVRWNPRLYLQAFSLLVAVALSYAGWFIPFLYALFVTNPGGITYAMPSNEHTVSVLYGWMTIGLSEFGPFLFLVSLLNPIKVIAISDSRLWIGHSIVRFGPAWRKWYPLAIPAIILFLAFLVNHYEPNMTQRSLVIVLPSLAVFLSYGLISLIRPARLTLILLVVSSLFVFVDYEFTGSQADVAAFIAQAYQAGSPVIMNVPTVSRQVALLYYIQKRMPITVPNTLVWQILEPHQLYLNNMAYDPVNLMVDLSPSSRDRLRQFLGKAKQVWYVERLGGTRFSSTVIDLLSKTYKSVRQQDWKGDYRVIEYQQTSNS